MEMLYIVHLTLYQAGVFELLKGRWGAFWPVSEKLL